MCVFSFCYLQAKKSLMRTRCRLFDVGGQLWYPSSEACIALNGTTRLVSFSTKNSLSWECVQPSGRKAFQSFLEEKNAPFTRPRKSFQHTVSTISNGTSGCSLANLTGGCKTSVSTASVSLYSPSSLSSGQSPSNPLSSHSSCLGTLGEQEECNLHCLGYEKKMGIPRNDGRAHSDDLNPVNSHKNGSDADSSCSLFAQIPVDSNKPHLCDKNTRSQQKQMTTGKENQNYRLQHVFNEAKDMLQQLKYISRKLETLLHMCSPTTHSLHVLSKKYCNVSRMISSSKSGGEGGMSTPLSSFDKDVSSLVRSIHNLLSPWTPQRYREMCSASSTPSLEEDFISDFLLSFVKVLLRIDHFFSSFPRVLVNESLFAPENLIRKKKRESISSSSSSSSVVVPSKLCVYFHSKGELKNRIREWQSYSAVYTTLEWIIRLCVERENQWRMERLDRCNKCVSSSPSKVADKDHASEGYDDVDTNLLSKSVLHRHDQLIYSTVWKAALACRYQKECQKALGQLSFDSGILLPPSMVFPSERKYPNPFWEREARGSPDYQESHSTVRIRTFEEWCVRWWLLRPRLIHQVNSIKDRSEGSHAEEGKGSYPRSTYFSSFHSPFSFSTDGDHKVLFGSPQRFLSAPPVKQEEKKKEVRANSYSIDATPYSGDPYPLSLAQAFKVLSMILRGSPRGTSHWRSAAASGNSATVGEEKNPVCSSFCGALFSHAFICSVDYWYHRWVEKQSEGPGFTTPLSFANTASPLAIFWIRAIILSCRAVNAFPDCIHISTGTNSRKGSGPGTTTCEFSSSPLSSSPPPPFLQSLLHLLLSMVPIIVANVSKLTGAEVAELLQTFAMLGFSGECRSCVGGLGSTSAKGGNSGQSTEMEAHRLEEEHLTINIYVLLANRAGEIAETLTIEEMQRVLEAVEKVQAVQQDGQPPSKKKTEESVRNARDWESRKNILENHPSHDYSGAKKKDEGVRNVKNIDHTLRYAFESVCRIRATMKKSKGSIAL